MVRKQMCALDKNENFIKSINVTIIGTIFDLVSK